MHRGKNLKSEIKLLRQKQKLDEETKISNDETRKEIKKIQKVQQNFQKTSIKQYILKIKIQVIIDQSIAMQVRVLASRIRYLLSVECLC